MEEKSLLVQFLGDTPYVRIIDFLIEGKPFDYSKTDIAKGSNVSRVTLFNFWDKLEKFKILKETRRFGKTKLYTLNEENPIIKDLLNLEFSLIQRSMEEKELIPA